jgi:hypothetical protein
VTPSLTPELIKANALAAYQANRLTAQNPIESPDDYAITNLGNLYIQQGDKLCVCGIGASHPNPNPEVAKEGLRGHVFSFFNSFPDAADLLVDDTLRDVANRLLQLHDKWHNASLPSSACDKAEQAEYEARFLAYITPNSN